MQIAITTTAPMTARQIAALETRLLRGKNALLSKVAIALRGDVRKRIGSQDSGSWPPISKWGRAKGKARALSGAGALVKSRVKAGVGQVYAETPPDEYGNNWSLTQHHKGFTNKIESGSVVIIPLRNPSALGLPRNRTTFSFIERRAGKTPGRKIWPTREEGNAVMRPIASKWLVAMVKGVSP